MKIKIHNIESENAQGIATEIMFEVASARASKTELLQLLIRDKDSRLTAKLRSAAIRVLKEMKSRGAVQFFATGESFEKSTTEAKFLVNKYPEISYDAPENPETGYIFVKI